MISIIVQIYYVQGNRKLSVLHARLRNHCSDLNLDLCNNHIRDNPLCDYLRNVENAEHFFFECTRFVAQTTVLFNSTRQFHPLNISTLLGGNEGLPLESNISIFTSVQKFLKDSARFAWEIRIKITRLNVSWHFQGGQSHDSQLIISLFFVVFFLSVSQ